MKNLIVILLLVTTFDTLIASNNYYIYKIKNDIILKQLKNVLDINDNLLFNSSKNQVDCLNKSDSNCFYEVNSTNIGCNIIYFAKNNCKYSLLNNYQKNKKSGFSDLLIWPTIISNQCIVICDNCSLDKISLFHLNGSEVFSQNIINNNLTIDFTKYLIYSGTYYLQISNNEQSVIRLIHFVK